MIDYNKSKIREQLSIDSVYQLLEEYGGDPEYTDFGILCSTICHNFPGEGSKKLYYYSNTTLFKCYTGCDSTFDIFELTIKVFNIQQGRQLDLNDAVRYVANKFGIAGEYADLDLDIPEDWKIFDNYSRIHDVELKDFTVELKDYDLSILDRLNYNVEITPWLKEGMTQEALDKARIGFYPGADQISIPHFDGNGRFIGLRGRALAQDDVERWGKYRPIKIMNQWYTHPLGMNLYGLNWAKDNIAALGKAFIFESEKSVLLYMSYFGIDNNIATACCGSNVSAYQIHSLIRAGANEIIIAFDRQFQEIGDKEFEHLTANLTKIHNKYKNDVRISFIFDKNMITSYKASPIDEGPEKFMQLFMERIYL